MSPNPGPESQPFDAAFRTASKTVAPVQQNPALVEQSRKNFNNRLAVDRENRVHALEDLKFIAGQQWDPEVRRKREADDRPVITVNQLPQFVKQVTGDIRRNRPSIQCTPGDGDATPETAQVYEGMIRSIERESGAQRIYSRAADQACRAGMGSFRLVIVPAAPLSLDRELRIQGIRNPFAVVWGEATEDDKRDAKECWVHAPIPLEDFKKHYPNATASNWTTGLNARGEPAAGDSQLVSLCEYWRVDETPVQLVEVVHSQVWTDPWGRPQPPTGATETLQDPTPEFMAQIAQEGWVVLREGEGIRREINSYLLAGDTILKGPVKWEGERIPIFTVTGEEVETGDQVIRHGLVRFAKDAQRLLNAARSGDAEAYGLSPKVPWVVAQEQIEGHEKVWQNAHRTAQAYLPYNLIRNDDGEYIQAPRPQREPAVQANPGLMAMAQSAANDMRAVIGIYNSSLGGPSSETSGVAIDARDRQADTGTFVYVDNLMAMIEALGRELVCMIPKIYSTRQWVRVLGRDDAAAIVQIKEQGVDLGVGQYSVIVQTGPAHATARKEAAAGMLDLVKVVPPEFAIELITRIAKLQDWQDADELSERFMQIAIAKGMLPQPGLATPPVPGAPPPGPGAVPPGPGVPPGMPPGMPLGPGGIPNIPGIPMPARFAPPPAGGPGAVPPELLARIMTSPGAAPAGFERVAPRFQPQGARG